MNSINIDDVELLEDFIKHHLPILEKNFIKKDTELSSYQTPHCQVMTKSDFEVGTINGEGSLAAALNNFYNEHYTDLPYSFSEALAKVAIQCQKSSAYSEQPSAFIYTL